MTTTTSGKNAHWVGRAMRLSLGLGALWIVFSSVKNAGTQWIPPSAAWFAGLFALYFLIHILIRRYRPNMNCWIGAILANVPALAMMFSGVGVAQLGALIYVGLSTITDAVTGDAGCEVMAFPGLLTGQRTHLACVAFSPVDWLELKILQRLGYAAEQPVADM